jgi:hypothetical protein
MDSTVYNPLNIQAIRLIHRFILQDGFLAMGIGLEALN